MPRTATATTMVAVMPKLRIAFWIPSYMSLMRLVFFSLLVIVTVSQGELRGPPDLFLGDRLLLGDFESSDFDAEGYGYRSSSDYRYVGLLECDCGSAL